MKNLIVVLAIALTGCGGTPDAGPLKLEDLFPKDNDLAGWVQDTAADTKAGPIVFDNQEDVDKTDIDGDVVPFNNVGFKALGRQHYKKDTYKLDLRVWQMKTTAGGTKIYTDLPGLPNSKYNLTWTNEAIGTAGRFGNGGNMWRVNAHKAEYFIEVTLMPSEETDTVGRDQSLAIVKFVAAKIP